MKSLVIIMFLSSLTLQARDHLVRVEKGSLPFLSSENLLLSNVHVSLECEVRSKKSFLGFPEIKEFNSNRGQIKRFKVSDEFEGKSGVMLRSYNGILDRDLKVNVRVKRKEYLFGCKLFFIVTGKDIVENRVKTSTYESMVILKNYHQRLNFQDNVRLNRVITKSSKRFMFYVNSHTDEIALGEISRIRKENIK